MLLCYDGKGKDNTSRTNSICYDLERKNCPKEVKGLFWWCHNFSFNVVSCVYIQGCHFKFLVCCFPITFRSPFLMRLVLLCTSSLCSFPACGDTLVFHLCLVNLSSLSCLSPSAPLFLCWFILFPHSSCCFSCFPSAIRYFMMFVSDVFFVSD